MASSPSFDQNYFASGYVYEQWDSLISNPFRPMENKAIQGEYPPGSTYKVITALAGLEEGVIDESTEFFCPGYYRFGASPNTGAGKEVAMERLTLSKHWPSPAMFIFIRSASCWGLIDWLGMRKQVVWDLAPGSTWVRRAGG